MWLFTKRGFYSIVRKSDDEWHVRARAKKDLENLLALVGAKHKVHRSVDADYRWRIVCGTADARQMIARLSEDIDYSNFKGKIAATPDQADKLRAYHDIWGIMYDYQCGQNG